VVRKAYDEVKCASHVREEPLRQREEQVQRLTGGAYEMNTYSGNSRKAL